MVDPIDITTRVALLEQRVDGLVDLFEVQVKNIEDKLEALASSVRWTQHTMVGLLVTVVAGVVLLLLKGV